jgi:hypothetical protein
MANVERRIEGFGYFSYDQAVYDELMRLGKAELVERELEDTIYQRTAVRGLKKADLAVLVAHRETARREWNANSDQSVNEAVDGAETNRDEQPSGDDHLSAGDHRDGCECTDCEEFYADEDPIAAPDGLGQRDLNEGIDEWHAHMAETEEQFVQVVAKASAVAELVDPETEAANDVLADVELLGFLGGVIEQIERELRLPITETDVRTSEGQALVTLVQSGSKLVWGKLIAVINRRTKYAAPLLATIEFPDGIRRLVSADDILVSDQFAAA